MWKAWINRRRDRLAAKADAADMVARLGVSAYRVARQAARDQDFHQIADDLFPQGHWSRVRREVGCLLGRDIAADGPRYQQGVGLVLLAGLGVLGAAPAPRAEDVRIQVLQDGFACRDLTDIIRLGLRMAEGDKPEFLTLYTERQAAGACRPSRRSEVGVLDAVQDEQGLHLVCIRMAGDHACWWALNPVFGAAEE